MTQPKYSVGQRVGVYRPGHKTHGAPGTVLHREHGTGDLIDNPYDSFTGWHYRVTWDKLGGEFHSPRTGLPVVFREPFLRPLSDEQGTPDHLATAALEEAERLIHRLKHDFPLPIKE